MYSSTIFSETFGTGFATCTSLTMSGAACFRSISSLIFLLAACDSLESSETTNNSDLCTPSGNNPRRSLTPVGRHLHAAVKPLESEQLELSRPLVWTRINQ